MLTGLIYVCVCVCVCVGTVNGVFIYRTQKGKWLCDVTNFPTQLSLPNFETQNLPTAQLDTACNTSASCCTVAADMSTADSVMA